MKMLILKFTKTFLRYVFILAVLAAFFAYLRGTIMRPKSIQFDIWKISDKNQDLPNIKYVLIWSKGGPEWNVLKEKQFAFQENKCQYNNCYITSDKKFLEDDYRNFDAILFNGKSIVADKQLNLPRFRSLKQLYIFTSKESSANYPVCDEKFDGYFNLTWTYKLDSDIPWTYFSIHDYNSKKIGPRLNMKWITVYHPVNDIIEIISHEKTLTAVWIASNCFTNSRRETLVDDIKFALKKYGLTIDMMGSCGDVPCPTEMDKDCIKTLHKYHFYLAFENSIAEDYITEKVTTALNHYTIPVVFGGANYSRFLPPIAYINAAKLTPKEIAGKMAALLRNRSAYLDSFRWREHYSYSEKDYSMCRLCELLNQDIRKQYTKFREWWNPNFTLSYGRASDSKVC